jgi:hypothetical protein
MVTLDGHSLQGDANGLVLQGGNATVMALAILNFPGNGILVTSDSNTIGGDQVGVDANGNRNNPAGRITSPPGTTGMTPPVFVRPPQGNVISANGGDGVRIVNGDSNLLEGNFIGTDATGLQARGNGGDGVEIIRSSKNKLYGTTPPDQDNPFVFYNVISGNKGNGLVIDSSDHTEVYANFFGLGADNNTPVGNQLDGVLIEGTSDETRFGLNIPLGNVTGANGLNGVEARDSASRTLLMNTFDGIAAFNPSAQVANHGDGLLITSDGGGMVYAGARFTTLVVTNQFSGNDQNGIEINGEAAGVQISQSVIGLQTNGKDPQPNQQNGIDIGGNASGLDIGGFEPSVLGSKEFPDGTFPLLEAANLISGNLWNGVAVGGNARNVKIVNSFIGTDITHELPEGNGRSGILIDGVSGVQIGSAVGVNSPRDRNIIAFNTSDGVLVCNSTGNSSNGNFISGNGGDGIDMINTRGTTIGGNWIGLDSNGNPMPNAGNGILLVASSNNTIGGTTTAARNLISSNDVNGIDLDDSTNNQVQGNFIGTDPTGTQARGNGNNGILLTNFASGNLIGGAVPASPVGQKPPNLSGNMPLLGNLISGNGGNGVLLTVGAKDNTLEGNFIGTKLSGVQALGNALDGVAIVDGSNNNSLLGTIVTKDPFIFYNVVSGNTGNGLRISDSNNTLIQANFFGVGSDDATPVGNGQNGVVIQGSSADTTFGGVIPLGNVVSANGLNGIIVADAVSGFLAENTFCGVGAFTNVTNLGNGQDGMLITSTGGNNVIKIGNIIGRNGADGIEVGGEARGVQIVQNMIGVNTDGTMPMPNGGNGVEIDGSAHDIVIGGPQYQFSIVPTGTISANGGYGVAVTGSAYNNQINFSYIGTGAVGAMALGNQKGGVYLGPGTSSTAIGSTNPALHTVISGNLGDGIDMNGTQGNTVVGCLIGSDKDGNALANAGNGILIIGSSDNPIGGTASGEGNVIAFNNSNGVFVQSGQGNTIQQNSIYDNAGLGIRLLPGANGNQAAPVLTSAVSLPGGVSVSGTLTSTPDTIFTIELYANPSSDPSGSAQGQIFLGFMMVMTDDAGVASFTFTGLPSNANVFTATATDPAGQHVGILGLAIARGPEMS